MILTVISKVVSSIWTASTPSFIFLGTAQQVNKENKLKEGISTYNGNVVGSHNYSFF